MAVPIAHWKMNDDAATTFVTDSIDSNNGTAKRNTDIISVDGKINTALSFGVDDNLVAHWKMNDNLATTNVIDSIGNYNGTSVRNTDLMSDTGKINESLQFNGISDKINTGFNPSGVLDPLNTSLAAWYYWDGSTDEQHIITNTWKLGIANRHVRIYLAPPSVIQNVWTTAFLRENDWNHVVASSDSESVKVYVNGVLVGESSGPNVGFNNDEFDIGAYNGSTLFFNNKMDDIRVYSKSLSQEEVTGLYNSDKGTEEVFPDYINCGNDSSLDFDASVSHTFTAWVKTADGDTTQVIMAKEGGGKGYRMEIHHNNIVLKNPNGYVFRQSQTGFPNNEWVFLTAVLTDSFEIKFYINGVDAGINSEVLTTWNDDTTSSVIIGSNTGNHLFYTGAIDDVRIYNEELTQSDITQLYSLGAIKLNIADNFKDVANIKINIGDSWKGVTSMKQNIGGVWKDVF